MLNEIGKKALLFDFYGPLLTDRQQEVYIFAHDEDMSLGEIAGELNISRQAVYDILRRTDKILENYEKKLGLVENFLNICGKLDEIKVILQSDDEEKDEKILREIETIYDWERR